jgi:hypothetical protein
VSWGSIANLRADHIDRAFLAPVPPVFRQKPQVNFPAGNALFGLFLR